MLLIDDILFFPLRGVFWIAREVHNAAQQEFANELDSARAALSDLYMMLETGRISEQEFEMQEAPLLDRLDELERREAAAEQEEQEEQEVASVGGTVNGRMPWPRQTTR